MSYVGRIIVTFIIVLLVMLVTFNLIGLIPNFFDKQDYAKKVDLVLYLFVPLGYALFSSPNREYSAPTYQKIISFIGFLIMVISTLLLHLDIMADDSQFAKGRPGPGLFLILTIVWIHINITFHDIGNEHYGWSWIKILLEGFMYLVISTIGLCFFLNIFFYNADCHQLGIIWLIPGCISMIILGISRLKNGSPFN